MDNKLQPSMPLNRPMTQQRPKDPNRFRTFDVTPDGAQLQHDPQYQQMVADVEAMQQRQAFDKDDALFLRDKEREQQYQEQHKRDSEAAAFAAARARSEQLLEQQAAAKLRQQDMSLPTGSARPQGKGQHSAPKLSVVSVKLVKQQAHHQPPVEQPTAKRARLEAEGPVPAAKATATQPVPAQPVPEPSQPVQCTVSPPIGSTEALECLLDGYGSDEGSDADSDDKDEDNTQCPIKQTLPGQLQLPSAAELLQAELQSTIQQQQVQPIEAPEVHAGVGSHRRPPDLGSFSWV